MNDSIKTPWRVETFNRDIKCGYQPVSVFIGKQQLRIADSPAGDEIAYLIAAAPDLHDVVAEMVAMMDSGDEHGAGSPWYQRAVAALAKSRGEA